MDPKNGRFKVLLFGGRLGVSRLDVGVQGKNCPSLPRRPMEEAFGI